LAFDKEAGAASDETALKKAHTAWKTAQTAEAAATKAVADEKTT